MTYEVNDQARGDEAPSLVSRRDLLRSGALLGGSTLLVGAAAGCVGQQVPLPTGDAPDEALADAAHQINSVCLNCNTGCGIKAKLVDGVIAKIDGNPYSPWTMTPHVPYATSIFETAGVDGALCPKGMAGMVSVYDPYRITRVLKRAGRRGEDKWTSVPFEQAIAEIVDGGRLFATVPGEETREVTGLRALWAVRDPSVAKALAADGAMVAAKRMTVPEFKAKHADKLDLLIDPEHPDFGPVNNQLVFAWGRLKAGRSEWINRFTKDAFGSTNAHGHTTVCQGSLYFTGKGMSEQYLEGRWTGGKKFYWQADTGNSEFIIFVGASPLEGNYGPPLRAPKIANGLSDGTLKFAVVDPRLSKTAAKAWKWLPGKPGTEAALALGMIRWVLENERYDARYLRNANKAAATADGELNWCNATWLVKLDAAGRPGAFLRASELGLPTEERQTASGGKWTFDPFVVLADGEPVAFDPYDTNTPVEGDLFVDGTVQGIRVKTGLQLLRESAQERTLDQVAEITGLRASDIAEVAREFTNHGKRAAVDVHRGASQHTNGFYNVFAWFSLNLLIGNYDWKGGMSQLSTYDISGSRQGQPYNLGKLDDKAAPWGISIIRHDVPYESTTLFDGYPARRPFYPLASDIYQEIVPSIGDAYPYPAKALFLYMGSPVYSLPAGHTNIDVLADVSKLPLFVASDIVIGETSMYADYIFPDLSYLERWEFHGSHPSVTQKVQPVRQPVIGPLVETCRVYGNEMPICLESMVLGIAERLGLPGFGRDAFGPGLDLTWPEELHLRAAANLAAGERPDGSGAVPDASDAELEVFLHARAHLPPSVYDPARWERIVGPEWWRKVVYVLNRGGRFDDYEAGYNGPRLRNAYGTLINLYQEKTAKLRHSMTGEPLPGVAVYLPGPFDALGRPIQDERDGYDLHLITYREMAMTKSRTASNYWLLGLMPENHLLLNKRDADRLGLQTGDQVRLTSATNPAGVWDLKNGQTVPMTGRVRVIQGIRPGVVAFSLGHGHWAYGSRDVTIDGQVIAADRRRSTGFHGNAAMRVDPVTQNTTLSDLFGGSAVFYDTKVKLVRA